MTSTIGRLRSIDLQVVRNYQEVDYANARLREFAAETVEKDWWKLLWVPPSMPYLNPAGVFSQFSDGSVIQSFTDEGDAGMRVLHALIGILSVIVGFALLRTPFQSVEVVIFVIGIFWVAQGIVTFITAFSVRQGRGWRLFMGAIGVLAGLVVLEYPIDSALTLAFFGGIWLVILGIMQVVAGFQLRAARA